MNAIASTCMYVSIAQPCSTWTKPFRVFRTFLFRIVPIYQRHATTNSTKIANPGQTRPVIKGRNQNGGTVTALMFLCKFVLMPFLWLDLHTSLHGSFGNNWLWIEYFKRANYQRFSTKTVRKHDIRTEEFSNFRRIFRLLLKYPSMAKSRP